MRILFLAEARSVHSQRWVHYFAEQGHDVDWITLSDADPGRRYPNLRLHHVSSGPMPIRVLRATALARRIARARSVDLVHAHYAGTYGVVGMLAGIHPFVLTAWGSDVLTAGRSAVFGPVVRRVLRSADLITCDAEHLRDAMASLGAALSKIRIVYFGTDTSTNHPGRASAALRATLNAEGRPLIISVRTLHPLYDVGTLIRAVPDVLKRFPDARFAIGGDGEQRAELERLAADLGVGHAVVFLGSLTSESIPVHLATADVYVSTSTSDGGLAASTAEAMACGTAVVITDFGQNREWVEDGRSGLIVPIGDAGAVARAIIRLLDDAGMRRTLGLAGRAVIEERNNYRREMARMESLYGSLARGGPLAAAG